MTDTKGKKKIKRKTLKMTLATNEGQRELKILLNLNLSATPMEQSLRKLRYLANSTPELNRLCAMHAGKCRMIYLV